MLGINYAIPCDDQPINSSTLFGETRWLTSWVDPDNLQIQNKYEKLTKGLYTISDKIRACWEYVKFIPYTPYVKAKIKINGRTYANEDVWLDPAQTMNAGELNCMNKSILLASLLRQELSDNQVYVCLNNIKTDGIGGHAVCYLNMGSDYILETTNPNIRSPFIYAETADAYESVAFMNDSGVWWVEDKEVKLPLGVCCVRWLEDYINSLYCDSYI